MFLGEASLLGMSQQPVFSCLVLLRGEASCPGVRSRSSLLQPEKESKPPCSHGHNKVIVISSQFKLCSKLSLK